MYPQIKDTAIGLQVATNPAVFTIPASVKGDLLVIFIASNSNSTFTATSWTNIQSGTTINALYKIADGTEGTSLSVSSGLTQTSSAVSYSIGGFDPSVAPVSSVTTSTGTTVSVIPPALTSGFGAAVATLWLVGIREAGSSPTMAWAANYTLGRLTNNASGQNSFGAGRHNAVATETPGTSTLSVAPTPNWRATTVAIRGSVDSNMLLMF